jgi:nicotinate phosphoribosyltransferase
VGTKLVTAFDQPALGGVYKLGASRDATGAWHDSIKLSEQPIKISNPGLLQVRRLRKDGQLVGDIIYDSNAGVSGTALHDIEDPTRAPFAPQFDDAQDVLVTMLENGKLVRDPDSLLVARERAATELGQLSPRTRRFLNPQPYPVGLDRHVHVRKQLLIAEARKKVTPP